jgi:hypothetical protein
VFVSCEIAGCSHKGMWTRANDMRVLCTGHDRVANALAAVDASDSPDINNAIRNAIAKAIG